MKKRIMMVLMILVLVLSGCGIKTDKAALKKAEYFGDYENEPMYQKIIEIESCVVPEQLVSLLEGIYGEKILYIHLEYDEETGSFKKPYDDFKFNVFSIYSAVKNKGSVTSDAYAFFKEYHESPVFIMDKNGSYLVGNYEVETLGKDNYLHKVNAWSISDLYLCLHGYAECEGDTIRRGAYTNIVKSMGYYADFEAGLSENADGSTSDASVGKSIEK